MQEEDSKKLTGSIMISSEKPKVTKKNSRVSINSADLQHKSQRNLDFGK